MVAQKDTAFSVVCEKRIKSHIHIHYGPYQNIVIKGHGLDISTGGLYLKTELPLTINEHISLIFHVPYRTDPVTCNAKVAWTNPAIGKRKPELPPGVGVEFIDLTQEELSSISYFIKKNGCLEVDSEGFERSKDRNPGFYG